MTRVAVLGAHGRMGRLACEAVDATVDLELVARVTRDDRLDMLAEAGADVAVDLTEPAAAMDHVAWCIAHGVHLVEGTSGFTTERLAAVEELLGASPSVGVLVVPNFSVGAALMMRYAAQAARFFESVEIVELHHPDKLDAPSGTAVRTARLVAQARADAGLGAVPDATEHDHVGARGGRVDGIAVHSVRARGLVAHQEVVLGNVGETLTIRHDMPDRAAAMPGLVAAVRAVSDLPGLTVGLDRVLGLDG